MSFTPEYSTRVRPSGTRGRICQEEKKKKISKLRHPAAQRSFPVQSPSPCLYKVVRSNSSQRSKGATPSIQSLSRSEQPVPSRLEEANPVSRRSVGAIQPSQVLRLSQPGQVMTFPLSQLRLSSQPTAWSSHDLSLSVSTLFRPRRLVKYAASNRTSSAVAAMLASFVLS